MSLILKYDLGNPHRLPVGYTPLAYIESTGTLWIDTGWLPTGNTQEVNIHFIPTASLSSKSICGGQPASSAPRNLILHSGSYFYTADNYISCTAYNTINLKYHVRMTNNVNSKLATVTVNGTTTNYAYNTATLTTTYTYHLFTNNNGGNKTSQASSCKIYYCNIINNGSLFGEYIPAKRNSDGVIGMFDIVSQTFKTNAGTGSFIAGPEVVVLPYEYLQVEYLENNGTQRINTGYDYDSTNNTYRVLCLFLMISAYSSYQGVYGAYTAEANSCFRLLRGNNNTNLLINSNNKAGGGGTSLNVSSIFNLLESDHTYDTCTVKNRTNNTTYTATIPHSNVGTSTTSTFFVFDQSSGSTPSAERIYYFKLYTGTTLVRDMIPCYRRSDLKPGMYDTVNNVFYTNSGSGEFILGPVVEESSRQLEYNNAEQPNYTPNWNVISNWTSDGATVTQGNDYIQIAFSGNGNNRGYYVTSNLWTTVDAKYLVSGWIRTTSGTSTVLFSRSLGDYGTDVTANTNWTNFSTIITATRTSSSGSLSIQGTAGTTILIANLKTSPVANSYVAQKGIPYNVHYSISNPSSTLINLGSGEFDGTSSYVKSVNNIGFSGDPNISISTWVKCIDSTWNTDYVGICGGTTYSTGKNWFLMLKQGKPDFDFWSCRVIANNAISLGQWHHLVVTKSPGTLSTSTVKIYVDGLAVATTALSAQTPAITNSPVQIGRADSAGRFFHGYISDLRIYNNVLTADEVLQIYKGGL